MKKFLKILALGLGLTILSVACKTADDSAIEALLLDDAFTFLLTKDSRTLKKGDLISLSFDEDVEMSLGHKYRIKIAEGIRESYPYQGSGEEILEDLGIAKEKISLDQALALKEYLSDKITIIDVRTPEEYQGGHLPGAINIPVDNLANEIREDLDQVIVVYCQSGRRSEAASEILKDLGYKVVLDGGGISSYKDQV
ncbi:rhodanese-like domain-containing protein [Neofamilia massiliensis]|uniref:rhodanese-like domain-containing protein n=1 Tax=Neofamilia massiliensis TaxID=1673724 RepID=UPI0006BB98EA|nr:rhodanese-like domain-containing protein [Neofamilia massiliensis]